MIRNSKKSKHIIITVIYPSAELLVSSKSISARVIIAIPANTNTRNEDVSLNSIRVSGNRFDLTHNLENIVLNELIYLGCEVTVYNNKGREIDFRAVRDGKLYLVQVAYSVAEEKAYDREFSAFAGIDNTVKKIIITTDDIDYSTSTVYHYRLRDFLRLDEL